MKKNGMQGAMLLLCVLLLFAVFWKNQEVRTLREENTFLSEEMARQVECLEGQIEELRCSLDDAPAIESWSVSVEDVNTTRRELTICLSVVSAEGRDIQVVEAAAHCPGIEPEENLRWPRAYDSEIQPDGSFRLELTLPYVENVSVAFTVVYAEDGESHSQVLGTCQSMDLLLPVRLVENNGEMGYNLSGDGRLYLVHYVVTLAEEMTAEEPVFRLLKNGSTVLEASAERLEGSYSGYPHLEKLGGLPCEEGDQVELCFACRDQYGLSYEFILRKWEIVSFRDAVEQWPEGDGVTVTWPE